MSVDPPDSRQRIINTLEQKDGSEFQIKNAANWTRRPNTHWSRLAENLTFAGIVAMAGWLISAFIEQTPGGPAMSTEGFVERCLLTQMRRAYGNAELKEVSETQKRQAMEEFKQGPIYNHIFHQAKQFGRERNLVRIGENDIEEETKLIYFLISRDLELCDSKFIDGLHKTPEGRWILEELPKAAISEHKSTMVVSYVRILAHFNCFSGLKDMTKIREVHER